MHVNNCLFRGNTTTFGNRRISSLWHNNALGRSSAGKIPESVHT
jgi:hypothetical protein